ncbi:hypothetical protein C4K27_0343 [Pseudomonas chlororaphis subsp. chlororaphis]|nr:hypothetical protein C4K27_0343 [Pseudomonas chlororaphis subsp. chlororaphis]
MKYSEFRRWLKDQGEEFQPGKGSHFTLQERGRRISITVEAA